MQGRGTLAGKLSSSRRGCLSRVKNSRCDRSQCAPVLPTITDIESRTLSQKQVPTKYSERQSLADPGISTGFIGLSCQFLDFRIPFVEAGPNLFDMCLFHTHGFSFL